MNTMIEFLLKEFGGKIISHLLTTAAAALITHGMLSKSAAGSWVEQTTGIAIGLLTAGLTWAQHARQKQDVQTALNTPPPPQPPAQQPTQNFTK